MGELLLITDDCRRGERLARDLGPFRSCRLYDLYDDVPPTGSPELIISDVSTLTSAAIERLQRVLGLVRGPDVPFLFLTHGNASRAAMQAQILGANGSLSAGAMTQALLSALDSLRRHETKTTPSAVHRAGDARRFLHDLFRPNLPITPVVIDTGTGLIARAVQDVGVRDWVRAVQRFDNVTHQHCLLVAGLAAAFAGSLGLTSGDCHRLTRAALLHDIGKIQVPIEILNKPDRLTDVEMREMRRHPLYGHAMLSDSSFEPEMLMVVRSHHEMLDGSGYPDGLRGTQIPDLVRLITICDIYAALIERRSYKPPLSEAKALIILEGMGERLDPTLLNAFRSVAAAFDTVSLKSQHMGSIRAG